MTWSAGVPNSLSLSDFTLTGPTWVTITSRVKCTDWPGLVTSLPEAKGQGELHQNQMDWVVGERRFPGQAFACLLSDLLHHRERILWELELWWA